MAKKGVHSLIAVAEIARIMRISEKKAAQFCNSVRKHAKAKTTTDGQIYQCIRRRKTEWTPQAVARYTDGHAERIRKMVGHTGSVATKQTRNLYRRQYYVYRNSTHLATVHFSDCAFCNYGRGTNTSTTRGWFGPYGSRSSAISEARKLAKSVHLCEHCGGTLAIEHITPDSEN